MVHDFEDGVAKGDYAERGWPKWGYGISKLAINVYHNIFGHHP